MTETDENAYLARSMRVDKDEPIYAFRIGETVQAAKDAIEEATEDVAPIAVANINWDDDDDVENTQTESKGWYFQVDKYDLHSEE